MTTSDVKMGPKDSDEAEAYARLREPLTLPYGLDTLTALRVEPGERLLDLAAGTGGVALASARRGVEVVAVDCSPGMMSFLATRAKEAGFKSVSAQVMDGQKLDLPTDHFDAACSVFGIMFFPDHVAGLAELRRVLKPGGRVGVAVWQNPLQMDHLAIWERVARRFDTNVTGPFRPLAWVRMDTSEGLRQELEVAGFREISVVPVSHEWDVHSAKWFIDNFDASHAFCNSLGLQSRDQIREAVLNELRGEYGDGPFTMTTHAHIGTAIK